MGPNLSGSFSPSSIRSQESAAFGQVVRVNESGKYFLKENHISVALGRLLFESKMDAVYLSLFLHRDYGYVSDTQPQPKDVAACFRKDFRYDDPTDNFEFQTLYIVNSRYESYDTTDWFSEHRDDSSE